MHTNTLIDYTFKFIHLGLKHISVGKYLIHFFDALSFHIRQTCYTCCQSLYLGHELGHGCMQRLCGLVYKRATQPTWTSLRGVRRPVPTPYAITLPGVCGVSAGGIRWDMAQDLGWSV